MLQDGGEAYDPQLLAVQGFFFGTANIVIIALPRGWRTTPGWTKPDVTRWQLVGNKAWATEALGTYWVLVPEAVSQQGRGAPRLELEVRVNRAGLRPALPPLVSTLQTGVAEAYGHDVPWSLGEIERRLWLNKRRLPALTVRWECQRTGRVLELLFSGGTPEHLAELVPALAGLRCH